MATCNDSGATVASTTNASSYTSASFNVFTGELIVVFVGGTATIANGAVTDSLGGTYTDCGTANKNASADEMHVFIRTALIGSNTSMTVNWDCTGDAATGCIMFMIRVSGMTRTGLNAMRQFANQNNQAGGGTPAPTFAAACLTGNPTLGVIFNATNPAGMTPPTSWSELTTDKGFGTPTTGGEYVIRNSGFTGTTITWGSTSASAFCSIIIELDTSAVASRRIFLVT